MSVELIEHLAAHEGGTKFYRIVEVRCQGASLAISNWGAMRPSGTRFPYPGPRGTGSQNLHVGDSDFQAKELMRAKARRGYGHFGHWEKQSQTLDVPGAVAWLNNHFGGLAGQAIEHLGLLGSSEPSRKPEPTIPVMPEIDRGELWGTW